MINIEQMIRDGAPFTVAYGIGVDSTAVLVELVRRGLRPGAILFAGVGSEKPSTYRYFHIMNEYLRAHNFPEITEVRYVPKNFKHWPPYYSLEENCLTNGTLPSMAFGFGSCSQKWKAAPQHNWMKSWEPARSAWSRGEKVIKAIGYDCSTRDQQRQRTYSEKSTDDPLYQFWFPLQEWGWDRERCMKEIAAAGLPVPEKSSCFFCPAMKPAEVDALPEEQLARIVLMEARAKPRLSKVEGLWRKKTKKRPGTMTEYIAAKGLLSPERIAHIQSVPKELISYQEAFAAGRTAQPFSEFVQIQLAPRRDEEKLAAD